MLEDDRVAEVYLERPGRRSIAGNVYKGVVDNVLPGMEAAFVEIGLEKNGFLYVDEIVGPELEGKRHGRRIQDLISRGEEILVQAVKDPMKTKGARLTTEISLPGRFVVYVPQGEGIGVSRRLDDDERARLRDILKRIELPKGGVIVRTAAEGASEEDVERDIRFLEKIWKEIQARAKKSPAPALIYNEAELPLRVVRDLFTGDFEQALVDDDLTYKRIVGYLKKTSPHMAERVVRYREKEPLFEASGVDAEIRSTLNRRVDLPSGGYLVFDYAEAFTVIDVNTGRFVGSRSKTLRRAARGHDHEEQPRGGQGGRPPAPAPRHRRDHRHRLHRHGQPEEPGAGRGGAEAGARARPDEDLRRRDLAARPRRDDAAERHRRAARDPDQALPDLRRRRNRRLRDVAGRRRRAEAARAGGAEPAHEGVQGRAQRPRRSDADRPGRRAAEGDRGRDEARRSCPRARKACRSTTSPSSTRARSRSSRRSRSTRTARRSTSSSARSRSTTPSAAMGKLDGYEVCVGDAARLVGKKVKVRVERVLDGTIYASLVDAAPVKQAPATDPITAEGLAEKPTRATARKGGETGAAPAEAEARRRSSRDGRARGRGTSPDEPEEAAAEDGRPRPSRPLEASRARRRASARAAGRVAGAAAASRRGRGRLARTAPAGADATPPRSRMPTPTRPADPPPRPVARRRATILRERRPAGPPKRRSRSRRRPAPAGPTAAEAAADDTGEPDAEEPEPCRSTDAPSDGEPKKKKTRRGSRGGRRRRKTPGGRLRVGARK